MTVIDNRPVVSVTATDDIAREPGGGDTTLDRGTFTISRTGDVDDSLTVNIQFTGNAFEGKDFFSIGQTVFIPAGEASIEVSIDPITDSIPEGVEEVTLSILRSSQYGVNWEVRGIRTTSGNPLRPRIISAANINDARRLAKDLGIGAPIITPEQQTDTIDIDNRTPAPGPDLAVLLFQLANKTINTNSNGGSLGTATLRNLGNEQAGTFNVRFFLSLDRDLSVNGDFLLSTLTIPSLSAFASMELGINYSDAISPFSDQISALAAGSYHLIADVDGDGFVIESMPDNNTLITMNPVITVQ